RGVFFMKIISSLNVTNAMKVYKKSAKNEVGKVDAGNQPADQLELSSKAKEFQVAISAFKNLPDIREGKVNEIKSRLEQGSYNVSGREIAESIVRGIFVNKEV
ncbi:flagellar biosynthesis anti-sigma factor FlgM, partial [bacterium AH-315-G05]|nr:flagellar biosynthesis anti-sigma factor FlgM [bacterium AH-315-G05]